MALVTLLAMAVTGAPRVASALPPPAITSPDGVTFTVGIAGTFTFTTTGGPVPTLAEDGDLPTGITFTDNGDGTATLAGVPADSTTTGVYILTITAHNSAGPDATQRFTLTVQAGALAISVPTSADLGSGPPSSVIGAQLGPVQVTDDRFGANASWIATVSTTGFTTAGGPTIPPAAVSYWSGGVTASAGTGTTTPGQATVADRQTLAVTRTAFTLAAGSDTNSVTWNPTVLVAIPLTALAGPYSGTITHSVA